MTDLEIKAFEWAMDYKPWESRNAFRIAKELSMIQDCFYVI